MQEAPSAWSQMTPAERAAYYAANPTEGSIALGMQNLLRNATLTGQIAKYLKLGEDAFYDSRLEKLGLDPESFAYGPPDPNFSSQAAAAARQEAQIAAVNAANLAGAGLLANPMAQDPAQRAEAVAEANARIAQQEAQSQARAQAEAQAEANARIAQQEAQSQARAVAEARAEANARIAQQEAQSQARAVAEARAEANARIAQQEAQSQARERAESQAAAAAAAQAAQQAADARADAESRDSNRGGGGGYGGGGDGAAGRGEPGGNRGGWGRGGGYAKGGYVSMQHLGGPNPEGPDDGYAALKDGEYVINDKAVKKYGIELMNLINSGKISKGKLRGLLEM
jgi:hypothetical protein